MPQRRSRLANITRPASQSGWAEARSFRTTYDIPNQTKKCPSQPLSPEDWARLSPSSKDLYRNLKLITGYGYSRATVQRNEQV